MTRTVRRDAARKSRTMEWIYLESIVALALLVGIVWWTAGARRKPDARDKGSKSEPDNR